MFTWIKVLASRIRSWFSIQRVDQDFNQELSSHLDMLTKENVQRGMTPEDARRAARIRLGGVTQLRETNRDLRGLPLLENFLRDTRFAFRMLVKSPGFAAIALLTLALGIGANAAIFTLVRGVLLRPLVNRDENRLIYIRQSAKGEGADNVTFSVPEIQDVTANIKSIKEFGDFSQMGFVMVGLGDPRVVRGGVVGGSYFDVMGLHPVLGRLLDAHDDGPNAEGAVVLTYRFWTTVFHSDPSVLGKHIRLDSLGSRDGTIVGVLEPSVPYPADTEIIANIVCSPHHLSATMVTGRVHRMTELFGRLAPGATLEQARVELNSAYATMLQDHANDRPAPYSKKADFRIETRMLRDQITANARTVLLVLLAASGLIFIIACSNVANLILARTVRREGELAIRAALGATSGALRRTLLTENLLLCGAGALLGVLVARPMVAILARYAARYSVRALDLTVDSSMLWVGAGLAVVASLLLAFVPRLPSAGNQAGITPSSGSVRITGGTSRRLRFFVVIQIAASFVLLAGASMLLKTLLMLQSVHTGLEMNRVITFDMPVTQYHTTPEQTAVFYRETLRRIQALPGVDTVAIGSITPWRDGGKFGPGIQFTADGYVRGDGEEYPRSYLRASSPGYFAALGVPILEGRDFDASDRVASEPVVIISQSVAARMFPGQDALDRHITWTDPVIKFIPGWFAGPYRIVGVAADIDDEHVIPSPMMTTYLPFEQFELFGGKLFVHASVDPYSLVVPITKIVHEMSADQVLERPNTLADVRAEVLSPDRLNTIVFGIFALVALIIAVVGVAGVLAFSVSARTREFGIRLALGSQPRRILKGVMVEGAVMAGLGIGVGAASGLALARLAGSYFQGLQMPSIIVVVASALVLLAAAVIASALPAARAARVDVIQALRAE
ncbi:MAG TPA: ADOP family duplicated permease [Candidatus Acidoferrales bacterium]|jgi:predicted permease|nr:ADOP family duplicated permease [Candidatus Acidoferrales bacterium]